MIRAAASTQPLCRESREMKNLGAILNVVGLSLNLIGTFLLSVEALRVARVVRVSGTLANLADALTNPLGKDRPLPLTWRFAVACTIICVVIWIWARVLLIWTITPAGFVILFLLHRFTRWAAATSSDGFAAVVGFTLLFAGTLLQLTAALL